MADSDLDGFEFREFEAGPRRDTARHFNMMVQDLSWLHAGPKKDAFLDKLREARAAALAVAEDMLR